MLYFCPTNKHHTRTVHTLLTQPPFCQKERYTFRTNYIYSKAIKKHTVFDFEYWVLRKMAALKCLYCHFVKRLTLQNTNSNFFEVINKGVMVLSSNSIVPIITCFPHGKWHSALPECLALMSVSKKTSLFNQKLPANSFKLN